MNSSLLWKTLQSMEVKWIGNTLVIFFMISYAMRKLFFPWNQNGEKLETNFWNIWKKFQELWFHKLQDNRAWSKKIMFFPQNWSDIANKVWPLLEFNLRTNPYILFLYFINIMSYFISYIHAKFQESMRILAKYSWKLPKLLKLSKFFWAI